MRAPVSTSLLVFALLAGCGESGPVTVRVFGYDPDTRTYGELDAPLDSLHDVTQMRGDAVTFVGGATVVGDAVAAQTDPKGNQILRAEGGGPPDCSFHPVDGVLHADDYDSLNMASAYFALQRARALFLDLGVEAEGLNALNAYYHPRVQLLTKVIPTFWLMVDNAMYAPPFDGFLILPHMQLQDVPFSANQGVMAHEYSHKVFNRLVERGAHVQAWLAHDWSKAATKQIRGVDEGVADLFGHLATKDPDYIQPSLTHAAVTVDRDLSKDRVMPPDFARDLLFEGEGGVEGNPYDPHDLGILVASVLWRFGEDLGDHRRIALALLDVERDLGEAIAQSPRYDFSTVEFLDRVAGKFEAAERAALCQLYEDRLEALFDEDPAHSLEACP